jgi:hypothetical protein
MPKKPAASKNRKTTKPQPRRAPRPAARSRRASAETSSLSVTDGAMKDVIRSAFLRREI